MAKSRVEADDIFVRANADPKSKLMARGFTVSTGASVGVSFADATLAPTVTAYVGGGGDTKTITADSLTVAANGSLPGSGPSADVSAVGSAGGLLLGVDATKTSAVNRSSVTSYIANGTTLDIQGATSVAARNETQQRANSSSDAFGLLAAGITSASVEANTTTTAYLGSGVKLTGGSLKVTASGSDDNYAETTAGAGGVAAGASASPVTINTSTVTAEIGDGVSGSGIDLTTRGSGDVEVAADHTATFNSAVKSNAAGFLSGAGADSDHTITSNVTAAVGDGVSLKGRDVEITANNFISKPPLPGDHQDSLPADCQSLQGGNCAATKEQLPADRRE